MLVSFFASLLGDIRSDESVSRVLAQSGKMELWSVAVAVTCDRELAIASAYGLAAVAPSARRTCLKHMDFLFFIIKC